MSANPIPSSHSPPEERQVELVLRVVVKAVPSRLNQLEGWVWYKLMNALGTRVAHGSVATTLYRVETVRGEEYEVIKDHRVLHPLLPDQEVIEDKPFETNMSQVPKRPVPQPPPRRHTG